MTLFELWESETVRGCVEVRFENPKYAWMQTEDETKMFWGSRPARINSKDLLFWWYWNVTRTEKANNTTLIYLSDK